KRLAEIHRASGVADEPVRGAMTAVHVRVDESRRDQAIRRLDRPVDVAVETMAQVDDTVALVDQRAIANERMGSVAMADDPRRIDLRSHPSPRSAISPI